MTLLPINEILCADNVATLKTFPEETIDLVVTSPPYDNLRSYGGHSWDFQAVAQELTRVLKPGGVIVWIVADATVNGSETLTSARQAIYFQDECGLLVHDTMIWAKINPLPQTHRRYEQCWEFMFILSKGRPKCWNPQKTRAKTAGMEIEWGYREALEATASRRKRIPKGDNTDDGNYGSDKRITPETRPRMNIWATTVGGEVKGHPAAFPESLATDHILSWSNEGEVVLDPFNGSGTTTAMARECGRKYIGIEINPDYCGLARKRLVQCLLFNEE